MAVILALTQFGKELTAEQNRPTSLLFLLIHVRGVFRWFEDQGHIREGCTAPGDCAGGNCMWHWKSSSRKTVGAISCLAGLVGCLDTSPEWSIGQADGIQLHSPEAAANLAERLAGHIQTPVRAMLRRVIFWHTESSWTVTDDLYGTPDYGSSEASAGIPGFLPKAWLQELMAAKRLEACADDPLRTFDQQFAFQCLGAQNAGVC